MRLNAVIKMIYRKFYRAHILDQLWNKSSKLGFSIKECIQLTTKICEDISEDVFKASFRLTKLKKFEFLEHKAISDEDEEEINLINRESEEEFNPDEPLQVPFECEFCEFTTQNSVLAAEHQDCHPSSATIKLNVGGINMKGITEDFGDLFREHTTVHQYGLVPNKEHFKKFWRIIWLKPTTFRLNYSLQFICYRLYIILNSSFNSFDTV